jgi:two-component system NtrC family sensor kinase
MRALADETRDLLDAVSVAVEVDLRRFDSGEELWKRHEPLRISYAPPETETEWLLPTAPEFVETVRLLEWKEQYLGRFRVRTHKPLDEIRLRMLERMVLPAALSIWRTRRYEQLRDAKREWEVTFDGALDGICITSLDGTIIRANRTFARVAGQSLETLIGRQSSDVLTALPGWEELTPWHEIDAGPGKFSTEMREFRFDDVTSDSAFQGRIFSETRWQLQMPAAEAEWECSSCPEETSDSHLHHVVVLREITESRRLQEQLLQSEKLAALGELVSGVAHELNNPLATVVGYSQLMEDDPSLPEHMRRQMRLVYQEAQRASGIVQNLLAFARGSAPEKMRLSVNEVLQSLVQLRAYQLQADNIRVTTDYAADLPLVWGDPLQLQQVFLNIINNAAQAMHEWRGGGELRIITQRIEGADEQAPAGLVVSFTDNGPGIAPEHLRRVFDPFFTTKGVGRGTGLGMSISMGIISNHNGRISAESRVGHGARFCIELPAMEFSHDAANGTTDMPHEGILPQRLVVNEDFSLLDDARRILVIDDEEPVITLISEILSMDGHSVTPAFNGAEALALLQAQEFNLIISDVRMPAVGGPTFFEILQTTRPDLLPQVIFVTGDTVSPSTQNFLQQAGRPMLTKPFDPDRLRHLVLQTLNESVKN